MHRILDPKQVQRDVGRRIAEIRAAIGWTQEQFATRADIGVKYVQQVERGRNARLSSLVHFANVLCVSMADLMQPPIDRTVRTGRPPTTGAGVGSTKKPGRGVKKGKASKRS